MYITFITIQGQIREHKTYLSSRRAVKDLFPFLRSIRRKYNGAHVSADAYIENQGEWTLLDHAYITEQGTERTWAADEADLKPITPTYETTLQN